MKITNDLDKFRKYYNNDHDLLPWSLNFDPSPWYHWSLPIISYLILYCLHFLYLDPFKWSFTLASLSSWNFPLIFYPGQLEALTLLAWSLTMIFYLELSQLELLLCGAAFVHLPPALHLLPLLAAEVPLTMLLPHLHRRKYAISYLWCASSTQSINIGKKMLHNMYPSNSSFIL